MPRRRTTSRPTPPSVPWVTVTNRRRAVWLALAALAAGCAAVVAAAWVASPNATALGAHVRERLAGTSGRPVSLDSTSRILREAVVATEDERFFHHDGIDVVGVVRALPYDLVHLTYAQGASTITEQVAKLLYLHGSDHSPWGKLEDAAVALKLESRYGKDEILAAYLDSAYFGEGAYGVHAAAERYFGVAPDRLGVAQATLLAGLIQAPSAYDPVHHPDLARARQTDVLRSLVRDGILTPTEASAALDRPLRLRSGAVLPPLAGVDLAPGPAFVWWELALGAALALLGAGALVASRVLGIRIAHGRLAVKAVALGVALVGLAEVVRSFRTA